MLPPPLHAGAEPAWGQGPALSLAAGGLAGAITVVANHPIDVVKSHLQVGRGV